MACHVPSEEERGERGLPGPSSLPALAEIAVKLQTGQQARGLGGNPPRPLSGPVPQFPCLSGGCDGACCVEFHHLCQKRKERLNRQLQSMCVALLGVDLIQDHAWSALGSLKGP